MASEDVWSAERYAANARFVSDLGAPVVELLAPRAGERILDLGCGDGVLSAAIAARGAEVTGIDASSDMVAAARARGIDASVADATSLGFEGAFDAVFSNAALHWMTRAGEVALAVHRALRPGGRFVGEFGGFGNVAAIRTALISVLAGRHGIVTDLSEVWYFPTAGDYRELLEETGFVVDDIMLIPRPTPVETGMEGWLTTLAAAVLSPVPPAARDALIAEAVALLAPALCDRSGRWHVDYVRLRFRARRDD